MHIQHDWHIEFDEERYGAQVVVISPNFWRGQASGPIGKPHWQMPVNSYARRRVGYVSD